MAIKIVPSDITPAPVSQHLNARASAGFPASPQALVDRISEDPHISENPLKVLQSTFSNPQSCVSSGIPAPSDIHLTNNGNGLVDTCLRAYNYHHRLVLRPDDVWLAVMTQFSFYVNAHADELRRFFVAHEGKRELTVQAIGTRYKVDFGALTEQMGHLLQLNVVDPKLRSWIVPDFTTTTANDRIVSSVVMMATLQKYFGYIHQLLCGLPAVILQGEKADWEKLLRKAEKLATFGDLPEQWHRLLKPVLSNFVRSFDQPNSAETKAFWQNIAHHEGEGSGPRYISGWLTAFCFFDYAGRSLYSTETPDELEGSRYTLDNVVYHHVDTNDIPPACASVPVKLVDNGQFIQTTMVAGSVGLGVLSPEAKSEKDTVQPIAGWWIYAAGVRRPTVRSIFRKMTRASDQ